MTIRIQQNLIATLGMRPESHRTDSPVSIGRRPWGMCWMLTCEPSMKSRITFSNKKCETNKNLLKQIHLLGLLSYFKVEVGI